MNRFQEEYKKLNAAQRTAVDHLEGPALVVAGAGTGKTTVIVDRILKLIETGVAPENILALTFTEKAAAEMLDRVNELRGGYTFDITISTFNAFGSEILKSYAPDIGLSPNQTLLGETGQLVFLKEHLDELDLDYYAPISSPDSQLKNLTDYFSLLKQQVVLPEAYQEFAAQLPEGDEAEKLEKMRHLEISNAYDKYIQLCRQNSVVDYDDQIYLSLELMRKRPNVRKKLTQKYQYILVDEFQDTNPMQSELLHQLAGKEQNLMVVGDDDQSIYGWRGATLKNILDFNKTYPNTVETTLIENFRSSQQILDAGYEFIQNNNPNRLEIINKLDKKLRANVPKGPKPKVMHFASLNSELGWLAEDIAGKLQDGVLPGEIAVLARRNAVVRKIHETLEANNIEHVVAGIKSDMYLQPVVATLIEALKTVGDPHDDVALFHTLGSVLFEIEPKSLSEASSAARKVHGQLSDELKELKDKQVDSALEQIDQWRSVVHERSVGQLAYEILSDSGWKDKLYRDALTDPLVARQVQALSQFFSTLKEFERIADTPSTLNYLNNLPALKSAGADLSDDSMALSDVAVNVLTIHKAKGLEWKNVYVVDLTEGSFPMRARNSSLELPEELKVQSEADDQMAEERRLLYVSITRAKKNLTLSFSDTHTGTTKRKPSRFLGEIPENMLAPIDNISDELSQTGLELFAQTTSAMQVPMPARMKDGENVVLSASQVGDYLRCPLDFYYRHILNVPQAPNPSSSYGTLIHEQIQKIHLGMISGKAPTLEAILASVEGQWPMAGYTSAKQRERAHEQGVKTLKRVYKRLTAEDTPSKVEAPFRVLIPGTELIVKGRIDAVFETKTGTHITDYKTGTTANTEKKAKSRATSSVQLNLYAEAWRLMNGEMPSLLSLDFVETGNVGSVKKQEKTLDNLEKKLAQIPGALKTGIFPLGRDHKYCRHPID